jgi:hypothetical protein
VDGRVFDASIDAPKWLLRFGGFRTPREPAASFSRSAVAPGDADGQPVSRRGPAISSSVTPEPRARPRNAFTRTGASGPSRRRSSTSGSRGYPAGENRTPQEERSEGGRPSIAQLTARIYEHGGTDEGRVPCRNSHISLPKLEAA